MEAKTTRRRSAHPLSYYRDMVKDMDDSEKLELVSFIIDSSKPAVAPQSMRPYTKAEINAMIDEAEAEARWKKLQEGTPLWKDDYKESYDEVFASFNKDWGGDGDALEIARSLREENAMTRTVDTW